ncbi:GNAT family N-acetyltransferase [Nitratireductor rhodophyticola]
MKLILAGETDKALIRRMLRDYLEELSAYGSIDNDYPYFDLYWHETNQRWPYIFSDGETVGGFAMVRMLGQNGVIFSMAEFAVLPAVRRNGLGRAMAVSAMHRHPGTWEISAMAGNGGALAFWPKAISAAGAARFEASSGPEETTYRFSIAPSIS